MLFFFDTETTGLPDFKAPSESAHQPHIVQLAAALVDEPTREIVSSIDLIVKPNGWMIPEEVSKIHGITQEKAEKLGIPETFAIKVFFDLWENSITRIAHNESFDRRIMRIAQKRYGYHEGFQDLWEAGLSYCTMQTAKPILQLPPTDKMKAAGFNSYKNPSLSECYKFFFDKELDGAHNAMVDVKACIDVYFAIQDLNGAAA